MPRFQSAMVLGVVLVVALVLARCSPFVVPRFPLHNAAGRQQQQARTDWVIRPLQPCVTSYSRRSSSIRGDSGSISGRPGEEVEEPLSPVRAEKDLDPAWHERSKHWVVLVDDEEAIRKAVGQLLFDRGYQVTACPDATSALRVTRQRRGGGGNPLPSERGAQVTDNDTTLPPAAFQLPSVMVLDVRMPGGMDGIELLKEIRSDPALVGIPVVMLTAKGMTQDRIAGYDAGADAYIPKPFDPEELVTVIDSVIARYETLNGQNVQADDLKREMAQIKHMLLHQGGAGVGNGWVQRNAAANDDANNGATAAATGEFGVGGGTANGFGPVFLAPDEQRVLELLCEGKITKEIAARTYLSTRRVEQLLTSMFRKANVRNRTELVRWAISTGHVTL